MTPKVRLGAILPSGSTPNGGMIGDKGIALAAFASWTLATVLLFAIAPPRRAAVIALVGGWLFLPIATYPIAGFPDYDKTAAIALGIGGASMLFDRKGWARMRLHWLDLPALSLCVVPVGTSLNNGLGLYDGLSGMANVLLAWGVPYALGRLYFADRVGLRELAVGVVIGGVVYVPFCLIEVILGPHLHAWIYGFPQVNLDEVVRFGGWRPTVFLGTGLMVGLWLAVASTVAAWCWASGVIRRFGPIPISACTLLLVLATVLVKSVNGWVLLAVGLVTLGSVRLGIGRVIVALLIAAAPLYVGARATGLWNGTGLTRLTAAIAGTERAKSVGYRLLNEQFLVLKALRRPVLGWGGWSRSQIRFRNGRIYGIADSLWVRELGRRGLVGLIACFTLLVLPPLALWGRHPVDQWLERSVAPAAALAVGLCLFSLDCCLNAMINPIYIATAGGLIGCGIHGGAGNGSESHPHSG